MRIQILSLILSSDTIRFVFPYLGTLVAFDTSGNQKPLTHGCLCAIRGHAMCEYAQLW